MTATGLLNVVSTTLDALRFGRFTTPPPAAAVPASTPAFTAIEMKCLRCTQPVRATIPPDEEGEGLAFQCTHCGSVAHWV